MTWRPEIRIDRDLELIWVVKLPNWSKFHYTLLRLTSGLVCLHCDSIFCFRLTDVCDFWIKQFWFCWFIIMFSFLRYFIIKWCLVFGQLTPVLLPLMRVGVALISKIYIDSFITVFPWTHYIGKWKGNLSDTSLEIHKCESGQGRLLRDVRSLNYSRKWRHTGWCRFNFITTRPPSPKEMNTL